jgi:hypothetical protein
LGKIGGVNSRLYLETTIPSYLTSRPSRDLIIAGHQHEVRRVREVLAARYGFDVKAIPVASKKRQGRSTHRVVSFVPKKKLSA